MLYIFNKDDKFLNIITEETGLIDTWFKDYQNHLVDEPFLFHVDSESELLHLIIEENQVAFYDRDNDLRLMRIKELYETVSVEGSIITAKCEPSFLELYDHFIEDRRFVDKTAQNALDGALQGSRYVGEVTIDLGTKTDNFYWINGIEAIFKILDTWGGALKDTITLNEDNEIVDRKIWIVQRLGKDRGLIVEPDYNAETIDRKTLSYPYTAMWGQGASLETEGGGYTRYITFENVEWKKSKGDPVDKPKGQKWVGDPQARQKYGYLHNGVRNHRFGHFSNQDYDTPEELLWATWRNLQENIHAEINHEATIDVLDRKVSLGDTVTILARELNKPIELQSQVTGLEYDILDMDRDVKIVVGKYVDMTENPTQKEIDDLRDKVDKVASRPQKVTDESFPDIKPPQPVNLYAVGGIEVIQLYWDYDNEIYIKHYEVYGSQVKDFIPDSQHLLWRGRVSSFAHTVGTDQKWYYRVRAVNYRGRPSEWSNQVEATTHRVLTDDILFGEELAARLRELSEVADIIADGSVSWDKISEQAKELIEYEYREYTDAEVNAVRDSLLLELADKAGLDYVDGQLNLKADTETVEELMSNIDDLNNVANGLAERVDETESILEEYDGKFSSIETGIDELEGSISATITDIERIDNVVESHTAELTAQADLIAAKVDSLVYERDMDGIVNRIEQNELDIQATAEGLELRVTKEEFESFEEGTIERISQAESTLDIHSEEIAAKVERSELTNYVTTQVYNNKISELTTSIDGISGRVSSNETSINSITGDISSIRNQVSSLDIRADGIEASVSDVRADLDGLEIGGRNLVRNTSNEFKIINNTGWGSNIGNLPAEPGSTVIVRVYVKPEHEDTGIQVVYNQNGSQRESGVGNRISAGSEGYATKIITFPSGTTSAWIQLRNPRNIGNTGTNIVEYKELKAEKGNKATDWSPAPEDVDSRLTTAESLLVIQGGLIESKVEITDFNRKTGEINNVVSLIRQDVNGISSTVSEHSLSINGISSDLRTAQSEITQLSDEIILKVNRNKVVSEINLNPEGIRLNGSLIELNGLSLIRDGVIGTAAIANASIITGKIANLAVTTGKIADASITNAKIGNAAIDTANIANAAVTNAKIASLSVDKLTGGIATFIQTGFNGVSNQVRITGSGLETYSGSSITSRLNASGQSFYRMGLHVGNIGTSQWVNRPLYRGLTFQMTNECSYMAWSHDDNGDGVFNIKLAWFKDSVVNDKGFRMVDDLTIDKDFKLKVRTISTTGFTNGSRNLTLYNYAWNGVEGVALYRGTTGAKLYLSMSGAALIDSGNAHIEVGRDSTGNYAKSMDVYNRTYTSTTQMMRVTVNGVFGRSTSSRRYKLLEEPIPLDYAEKILDLDVKSWFDKRAVEDYARTLSTGEETESQEITRIPGVIAEDVHSAGLEMFVNYDDLGRPDGVSSNLPLLLLPVFKDFKRKTEDDIEMLKLENQYLRQRIKQLEEKIA